MKKKRDKKTSGFWKQLKKNKPAIISLYVLLCLFAVALFAPILANEKPLYAKYNDKSLFPAFSFSNSSEIINPATGAKEFLFYDIADWKHLPLQSVLWCPVAFAPGRSDIEYGTYLPPFSKQEFSNASHGNEKIYFTHWLGTTKTGADVFAGLLHGTRVSLSIGIFAMLIAGFIGVVLGSLGGFAGDHTINLQRGELWMVIIGLIPAYFYSFDIRSDALAESLFHSPFYFIAQFALSVIIFLIVLLIFYLFGKGMSRISFMHKQIYFPVDNIISRLIEIFNSIPRIILIITIAAVSRPSIINLILIIGLTSWTDIARLVRAEMLRIKSDDYIQTASAMGFSRYRIILRHALPNALAPALVALAFGVASAILIESGLSFLGIGVPQDIVTWGSLLFQGKENFEAWWLVVFPGVAIFVTVTALNLVGDGLRDAMDVRRQ